MSLLNDTTRSPSASILFSSVWFTMEFRQIKVTVSRGTCSYINIYRTIYYSLYYIICIQDKRSNNGINIINKDNKRNLCTIALIFTLYI